MPGQRCGCREGIIPSGQSVGLRRGGVPEGWPGFTQPLARAGSVALLDPANGGFDRSSARRDVRVGLLGGEPKSRGLQGQTTGKQGVAAQIGQIKFNNQHVTPIAARRGVEGNRARGGRQRMTAASTDLRLTLCMTPHGRLLLVRSDDTPELDPALGGHIRQAFDRGAGHGLLRLGAGEVGQVLPPVFAYWRDRVAQDEPRRVSFADIGLATGRPMPRIGDPSGRAGRSTERLANLFCNTFSAAGGTIPPGRKGFTGGAARGRIF